MKRVIRMNQLVEILGISRSTIHRLRRSGQFVRSVNLGPRSVGYYAEDVSKWLDDRRDKLSLAGSHSC